MQLSVGTTHYQATARFEETATLPVCRGVIVEYRQFEGSSW